MAHDLCKQQDAISRRELLWRSACGLGSAALAFLLEQEAVAGPAAPGTRNSELGTRNPLAAKPPHRPAKAKSCIFLLMEGGPSHLDTFDPKPKLRDLHMTEFLRDRNALLSQMESGKRYYVASPFEFIRAGKSGIPICAHLPHLAECVDDICFYRGAQAESVNHPTALYHLNTGNQFGTDPALGAWISYGLGSLNQNLPAFVVLPDESYPQGGPANWSNGYLPAHYQGTPFRPAGTPLLDLEPPQGVTREDQRSNLDLLRRLNEGHAGHHPGHADLGSARVTASDVAACSPGGWWRRVSVSCRSTPPAGTATMTLPPRTATGCARLTGRLPGC